MYHIREIELDAVDNVIGETLVARGSTGRMTLGMKSLLSSLWRTTPATKQSKDNGGRGRTTDGGFDM